MSVKSYEKMYNELMANLDRMHKRNVQKTRVALRSLLIIPTIFLILVFMTDSSKSVFLVLWIASIFIIAGVLIVTEYQDYTLRKMVQSVEESDASETSAEELPEVTDTVEDADFEDTPVCSCEAEAESSECLEEAVAAEAEYINDTPTFTYDTPDESAARTEAEVGADS